jgi:hypothetical protein
MYIVLAPTYQLSSTAVETQCRTVESFKRLNHCYIDFESGNVFSALLYSTVLYHDLVRSRFAIVR